MVRRKRKASVSGDKAVTATNESPLNTEAIIETPKISVEKTDEPAVPAPDPAPEPAPAPLPVSIPENAWVLLHELADGREAALVVIGDGEACREGAVVETGERIMPASAQDASKLLSAAQIVHRTCPRVSRQRLTSILSGRNAECKATMAFQLLAAANVSTPLAAVIKNEALLAKQQAVSFRARKTQ